MSTNKDERKAFISATRKGKYDNLRFHALLKYSFSQPDRNYILDKLGVGYRNLAYNLPKPESHVDIRKYEGFVRENPNLFDELAFMLEQLNYYKEDINIFLELNQELEKNLLGNNYERCFQLLDEMDQKTGHSFYSLLCEYYVNEVNGDPDANRALLSYLNENKANLKLLILMNLTRFRIDQNVSSLQYEGSIEQNMRLYNTETQSEYIDYIFYKFDYINYDRKIKNFAFIVGYEGDFSIVDRYNALKRILPLILIDDKVQENVKNKIKEICIVFSYGINDTYWNNFRALYAAEKGPYPDRSGFHQIQDLFFSGKYEQAVLACVNELHKNPNHAELYLPLVQALIITNKELEEFIDNNLDLFDILRLMKSVLEKSSTYLADREKLLKKYFTIAHFDFSVHILEFVSNEYNLTISTPIQYISFLNSAVLRYNAFKLFKNEQSLTDTLKGNTHLTEEYLLDLMAGRKINEKASYLSLKVKIGYLQKQRKYRDALNILLQMDYPEDDSVINAGFMQIWVKRNIIKCYMGLREYGDAADVIVTFYFNKRIAFDHLVTPSIFSSLVDPFENQFSRHISIPIMFELYHKSQTQIYDTIANYLVANNVFIPSELIAKRPDVEEEIFHYFLEKCCTMENIEDSPFFNSINALEEERIKILNYLKLSNPGKIELYNKEILKISQDTSLRKGLLQIHESRIYVDEKGIIKAREVHLRELFDTYKALNELTLLNFMDVRLGGGQATDPIDAAYYFLEPIEEESLADYDLTFDYNNDTNAVPVAKITYSYYVSIFDFVQSFFLFDENYGFKSFLSMRIRHGTFSNVLRTVFEKYNLVSSKDSNTNIYQDIKYWDTKLEDSHLRLALQLLFKKFSTSVDAIIDEGLSWLIIKDKQQHAENVFFDFEFTDEERYAFYRNRVGRLLNFDDFIAELFKILFERLEICLSSLRNQISTVLTNDFVAALDVLQRDVTALGLNHSDRYTIEQIIVDCRTEIQSVTNQIENWFRISKNRYIEEFPIDLIIDTIVNYINSIYANALQNADLTIDIKCNRNIKGRYFESFGDMFINIFENIVTKNKEMEECLKITILIEECGNEMTVCVNNNVSVLKDRQELLENIQETKHKIDNYQDGTDISFEKGSGYVKICKSVAVDLERQNYSVVPGLNEENFEVTIRFNTDNLFA